MSKHIRASYYARCNYYSGEFGKSTLYCGVDLYQRKSDKSFYILKHGRRVSVAIVNAHGTVMRTDGKHFDNP